MPHSHLLPWWFSRRKYRDSRETLAAASYSSWWFLHPLGLCLMHIRRQEDDVSWCFTACLRRKYEQIMIENKVRLLLLVTSRSICPQGNPHDFLGLQDSSGQKCGVDIAVKMQPYLFICPDQQSFSKQIVSEYFRKSKKLKLAHSASSASCCEGRDRMSLMRQYRTWCRNLSKTCIVSQNKSVPLPAKEWIFIPSHESLCGFLSCQWLGKRVFSPWWTPWDLHWKYWIWFGQNRVL